MMYRSNTKAENFADVIDDLIATEVFPSCNETLDDQTLKIINGYEMEATMNTIETQQDMGTLVVGEGDNFSATFTEMGSSSIMTMSYDGSMLSVTFRSKPQMDYNYTVNSEALSQIRNEVESTLIEAEGSVGGLMNTLIRGNLIQLI